jgi:hypothetical protein
VVAALGEPRGEVADGRDVRGLVHQDEQPRLERSGATPLDDRRLVDSGNEREDYGPKDILVVAGGDDVAGIRPALEGARSLHVHPAQADLLLLGRSAGTPRR